MDTIVTRYIFERATNNPNDTPVKRLSSTFSETDCVRYRYNNMFDVWFSGKKVMIQRNVNTLPYIFEATKFTGDILWAIENKFSGGFEEGVDVMNIKDTISVGL